MKRNKKILVLCPYPTGQAAGQRLKYEQYFSNWRDNNFSIKVSSFFDQNTWEVLYTKKGLLTRTYGLIKGYLRRIEDLFKAKTYDVIYIFMWATPIGPPIYENLLFKLNKNIIYDFDDSVFLKNEFKLSLRSILKSSLKPRFLIKNAKAVILSSPSNLEYAQQRNKYKSVTYIPCSVDTKRFHKVSRKDNETISIGWTGTFSSIQYLDELKPMLLELSNKIKFKLLLITNFDYFIEGIDVEVIRWAKNTEIHDLNKIDIGLYPLIKDKWAMGKGGLKVIQYMSVEIPSIATDFGTAQDIIIDGFNGFLVNSNQEWINRIVELSNDPELRKIIGRNGRETIEKKYSVTANEKKYLTILDRF